MAKGWKMDFNINTDLEECMEDLISHGEGESDLLSSTSLFSPEFEALFKYWLVMCHNKEERDLFRLCRISLAKAYKDTHSI
jgi:hypothetical protein